MTQRDVVLALAESWVSAYNDKDFDRLAELFADDFVLHDMGMDLVLEGGPTFVEGIREVAETAIPDRRYTLARVMVDGSTAILEGSWEGVVRVEKWGLPPGSVRRHRSCTLLDTRDGRIVRMTDYTCAQE
jgi:ketosteroid isomerase-like protein